ncbi:MAG: enoyl-[acyl-carrier-protein] reductase FabK, partial [Defluviitaleaceae bacterium]|nr:enoyl-[acyl-carrier-protein] reductase FabK [Defluviitaleaceae bacterium]
TKEDLEHFTLGSLRKAVFDGNVDDGSVMAGQVAGMIEEIKPAKQIIKEMFDNLPLYIKKLEILNI